MRRVLKELKNLDRQVKSKIESLIGRPDSKPNFTELQILNFLLKSQDKTIYQKDLVEALNLKKSSVTERLDIMEEKEMIERICDEKDSRKKRIVLSSKSLAKKSEFIGITENIEEKIVKDIPKEKLAIFFEVLDKMSDNLERSKDEINL